MVDSFFVFGSILFLNVHPENRRNDSIDEAFFLESPAVNLSSHAFQHVPTPNWLKLVRTASVAVVQKGLVEPGANLGWQCMKHICW